MVIEDDLGIRLKRNGSEGFLSVTNKKGTTVTGRRNIIIAVGAIVLFAAVVGFYITLDVSPQIAYARLFIDVGLSIGLVAVILAFYRETPLAIEPIIQGLKSLKSGKYKTTINVLESSPLAEIAASINDLAKNLEQQHKKQEEIKRNLREELLPGVKQKEIAPTLDHSFHPELGPVCSVQEQIKMATKAHEPKKETIFQNALVDSRPPQDSPASLKTESLDTQDQDLGELYQRFIDAQREIEQEQIEYPVFLRTIELSRSELMKSHPYRSIVFDVVQEANLVALQPRIIR